MAFDVDEIQMHKPVEHSASIECLKINPSDNHRELEIANIPTTFNAFEMIIKPQYLEEVSDVFIIHLKISEILHPINAEQIQLLSSTLDKQKAYFFSFQSTVDDKWCFYWKIQDQLQLSSLVLIEENVGKLNKFVCEFLIASVKENHPGLF